MTVATSRPAPPGAVKELLEAGVTVAETARRSGWPHDRVAALISRMPGWLHDRQRDVAYRPGGTADHRAVDRRTAKRTAAGPERPMAITMLAVDDIDRHPKNIRDQVGDVTELADSIKAHGLLQPLVVQVHPSRIGRFMLIAGERRHTAAMRAGLAEVPAIIRGTVSDETAIERMLIENCHRENLSPMEKAAAFGTLRDCGLSQGSIARRTGFAQSTVSHYLKLLNLDDASQERVRAGELPAAEAISAVRKTRARTNPGGRTRASYRWEPPHLAKRHPLAKAARKRCDGAGHTMRRRIGDTACGQCWENEIRADERARIHDPSQPTPVPEVSA